MVSIRNPDLDSFERELLRRLLSEYLVFSNGIIEQINVASVRREKTDYFCITYFDVPKEIGKVDIPVRVPVEVHIFRPGTAGPMIVLLHIIAGCIGELEYFNADSSVLDCNVLNDQYEVVLRV